MPRKPRNAAHNASQAASKNNKKANGHDQLLLPFAMVGSLQKKPVYRCRGETCKGKKRAKNAVKSGAQKRRNSS
jgi:hypothetical protein